MTIPYSILDLSPVPEGATESDALRNTGDLAQFAESHGYHRYWLAEHHNMSGIASSATSVLIGYVAGKTKSIRVGSGGVMLPNHSPLVIAEQFGTLATLYPGRIDLGLGRAPGTDPQTARALRRDLQSSSDRFPEDVMELLQYLGPDGHELPVRAIPGAGTEVPIWILGSSLYGAQLAAHLGLPYAFASHFAPADLMDALAVYHQTFRSSKYLDKPYAMVLANVIAADTDEEARYLFTSLQQHFVRMRRNARGKLPAPIDNIETFWTETEKYFASQMLACSVVGSLDTVTQGLEQLISKTKPQEVMFTGQIHSHSARLHSFELAAAAMRRLNQA